MGRMPARGKLRAIEFRSPQYLRTRIDVNGAPSRSVMPETPLDNIIAMYEAFAEYL